MKDSAKFALVYFSISTLFLIASYIFLPNSYPGDSFLIVWMYVINIFIGPLLFPIFSFLVRKNIHKSKIVYMFCYFFSLLFITNIFQLLTHHIFYTIELVKLIFRKSEMKMAGIMELLNIFISFWATCLIFRNSLVWQPLVEKYTK
jgi:hypothetical protein